MLGQVPSSRFEKSFFPFFDFLTLEAVPKDCPETSIGNTHYSLSDIPEERSLILRGGSLRSRIVEDGKEMDLHNYVAEESCDYKSALA